ncbi:MAG: hypothetical protein V1716_02710 [Candidatus Uhrbacteria bacterium]
MSLLYRLPLGLLIIIIGFSMVWKTGAYQSWTGQIAFAEEKIGVGGTDLFLKLIGILVCFIGMAVMTNLISDILGGFAGIFIRG